MSLKRLLISIFCLCCFSNIFASNSNTKISITEIIPDTVNFGIDGQAVFTTTVKNIAADSTTLRLTKMVLTLPTGITLNTKSTSAVHKNVTYKTAVSKNTITIKDTLKLAKGESADIKFSINLSCEAIPTNDGSNYNLKVNNSEKIFYVENNESSAKSLSSKANSYQINIPKLNLSVLQYNPQASVKDVEWQTPTTDKVIVTNPMNAGSTQNMQFSIVPKDIESLKDVSIMIGDNKRTPSLEGDRYIYKITSSDLEILGVGKTFDGGEKINIGINYTPTKYYAQTQIVYQLDVIKNNSICNNLTNASATRDLRQNLSDVKLEITGNTLQKANFCGQNFIGEYVIRNLSEPSLNNTGLDAHITISGASYTIKSVKINDKEIEYKNGGYYLPISDLNGNEYGDFKPNSSYIVRVEAAPNGNNNLNSYLYVYIRATDLQGNNLYENQSAGSINGNLSIATINADAVSGNKIEYTSNFSFSDYSIVSPSRYMPFLDIDKIGIANDNGFVLDFPNNKYYNNQTDVFSIKAVCNQNQTFYLEGTTAGCKTLSKPVATAQGKTVIECTGEAEGVGEGGCYAIHTDSTIASPRELNTCEEINVKSYGKLTYSCKSKCSKIKYVIFRIYDLDSTLTFNPENCKLTFDGATQTMGTASDFAISHGVAWKIATAPTCNNEKDINTLSLLANAKLSINGNHQLPNKSEYNLRAEFAIITESGEIIYNNSKGEIITVYDPEVSILSSYISYTGGKVNGSITTTEAASSVSKHPARITNIKLPAIHGYSYGDYDKTGKPYESEENISGYYKKTEYWEKPVKAYCPVLGEKIEKSEITYTDFYANCSEKDTYKKSISIGSNVQLPKLEMNASTEENLTEITTFNLNITNKGNYTAPNLFIKIEPDKSNQVDLIIDAIRVGNYMIDESAIYRDQENNIVYANVSYINQRGNTANLAINGESRVQIDVKAENCQNHGNSKINITAIWSNDDIMKADNVKEEFEKHNCENYKTVLQLENKLALLESVGHIGDGTKLYSCDEPIPVHIEIRNDGKANLKNLDFAINSTAIPMGTNFTNNIIKFKLDNGNEKWLRTYESEYNIIRNDINNIKDTVISNIILPSTYHKELSNTQNIECDFSLSINCYESDSIDLKPIEFAVLANSNCGALQIINYYYNIPFENTEQVANMDIKTIASEFDSNNEANLNISLKNTSKTAMKNYSLCVVLPDGVDLDKTASSITGFTIVKQENVANGTKYIFKATSNLKTNKTIEIKLHIKDTKTCSTNDIAKVSGFLSVGSECGCVINAYTKDVDVSLNRKQTPLEITISGPDSVCVGQERILTASGADKYVWSDGNNTDKHVTLPNVTTYSVIGTSNEGCKGSATKTIKYVENKGINLSLEVNDKVITTGKIESSDWETYGESIIKSSGKGTLIPIEKPDATCGAYKYKYIEQTPCGQQIAVIEFEVINCCEATAGVENDLILVDGKPGYTLEDYVFLKQYVADPQNVIKYSDCKYTMKTTVCGLEYEINPDYKKYLDINNDGKIDNKDVDSLQKIIINNK